MQGSLLCIAARDDLKQIFVRIVGIYDLKFLNYRQRALILRNSIVPVTEALTILDLVYFRIRSYCCSEHGFRIYLALEYFALIGPADTDPTNHHVFRLI